MPESYIKVIIIIINLIFVLLDGIKYSLKFFNCII